MAESLIALEYLLESVAVTRVSVILLSYNHAKFIREAIDSTLGQTFADFELIVVDDCSSDNSWELIRRYSDQRVKSYRNERNIGGVAGVNRAISELASGELIAIHHSDDVWEPDKLEKQVAFLDAHPEIGAVFSGAIAIGEDGIPLTDDDHFYSNIFSQPNRTRHEWLKFFVDRGNALCHPSALIRKRVYDDCGLYINGLAQSADFNMWIRICMKYEVHVMQERLVRFRVLDNEANASGSRRDSRMRGVYELYKNFDLYLQIGSRDDLFKVFPSMVEFDRGDDTDIEFVVAMAAFEEVTFCTKQLFGIDILFKIISDPVRAKKVEELYGFGLKEFLALTGKYDLFSREEVSDLWKRVEALEVQAVERDNHIAGLTQAVSERDSQIGKLNQALAENDSRIASLNQAVADSRRELAQILASKSWLVTKPLRFACRVAISKPRAATRRTLSDKGRALWRALPVSYERKRAFKGLLFKAAPWAFRWSKAYQAWEAFNAPVDYSPLTTSEIRRPTETGGEYVPLIEASPLVQKPAKLICFYLPQFHAIPENNEWWGEGFTEWTNVQPAQPQFEGHYQPHVPGELGYYNLLDPAVQRRQVELAKLYGIGGFCFYFYWFGGKRLLEAPIENYLNDKPLDLPFCLCWANENWSRRWDGLDSEILMAQQHSVEDDLAFIRHVAQYMRDPRYIRINGKPLLLVYRPSLLPSAKETSSRWRDWCRANGLGEIYLAYTQSFEAVDPAKYGFDAAIEFPPNNSAPPNITDSVVPMGDNFGSTVYDWRVFVERSEHYKQQPYTLFRSVCPSWDNTARRKNRGTVFQNSTPALYQRWLENAIRDTQAHWPDPDERLIFVNAWNEWAEGAHLEPDSRYGYAYLQATRNALEARSAEGRQGILLVTHDCHPHGAQFLALEVARQLVRNGFVPAIVALDGGRLESEFARLGPMVVVGRAGPGALGRFLANCRGQGYLNAITSTVVSGSLLPELKKHGFRVLSLIHELPGVIRSLKQEENAQRIALLADQVVFPAELVRDQYGTIAPLANEKSIIRPQGLLRKNPYQSKRREAHREICRRHGLPLNARIVLSVGYLDHRKGADLFVEIAALVCQHEKDTVFIWVGHTDQGLERNVRKRIEALGLEERVLLVGFDPEPLIYYAAAAVYALTSREDPFPNVVLESAFVGVPIVAFEGTTGATGFIVQQGGLLAHQLDVAHFATQVEKLLGQEEKPTTLPPDLSLQRYVLDLLHYVSALPRVSVIVPNYNYAQLIERRLDSIHMQTYPVYELIVLDDASTDDSVTRIEDYCRKSGCDARLELNKVNSGSVFRQWVKGVQMATGDLVWIAEADDIADPHFLSTLVPAFSEKGIVLAFCQSRQIDERGRVLANDYLAYTGDISERWANDHFGDGMAEIRESLSIKNVIPNASAVLFDRQALLRAFAAAGEELFDYRVAGDWLVYLHILTQGRLYYSAKSLNDHRRHQQSVTSATALENHLAEVAEVQAVARAIALPDEAVLAQSNEYLERLRVQFGLDDSSIDRSRDAKRHIA